MPQDNPFDQFDTQASGPVYGAPRRPEKVDKPNLPIGYQMGSDGVAQRIPGLPPEKAQGSDGVGKAMTQNKQGELKDSLTSLKQFEADLSLLEDSFKKNFKDQGLASVREYLPGKVQLPVLGRLPGTFSPTNENYNSASMRLLPLVAKALGFTSKQMDTPSEIERLKEYVPSSFDSDLTAENKLKALRTMLTNQRKNINSQLGDAGQDISDPIAHGEQVLRQKLTELKPDWIAKFKAKRPNGNAEAAWANVEKAARTRYENSPSVKRIKGRGANSGGWGKVEVSD